MALARLAISLDPDLSRAVRKAAGKRPKAEWVAEAARQRLRNEGLGDVIGEWEAANGALSNAELGAADRAQRDAIAGARRRSSRVRNRSR